MTDILITGGLGFLGSTIARELSSKGWTIYVLDCNTYAGSVRNVRGLNVRYFNVNLTNKNKLVDFFDNFKNFKYVIHAAAETAVDASIHNPDIFMKTNILGTENLFSCLKANLPEKIINFGTDEIIDENYFPADENAPIDPRNFYSVSKAAQYYLGRTYNRTFGLPVINVFPSNCFGPRQHPEKLLPRMIYLIQKGYSLPIYGNGQQKRMWLDARDLARGISYILSKGKVGESYNIGGHTKNIKENIEIVRKISSLLGKKPKINHVKDRPGHDLIYNITSKKLQSLGWNYKYSLDDGLAYTCKWYKNRDNFRWLEKKYIEKWGTPCN